jgi:hypothetical protein
VTAAQTVAFMAGGPKMANKYKEALANLYAMRKATKDAKNEFWNACAAASPCNRSGKYTMPDCAKVGLDYEEWCDKCKSTEPAYRKFRSMSAKAGAALRKCLELVEGLSNG